MWGLFFLLLSKCAGEKADAVYVLKITIILVFLIKRVNFANTVIV